MQNCGIGATDVGNKAAGRALDGRKWGQFPELCELRN